jgi:ribonuclease P protein component
LGIIAAKRVARRAVDRNRSKRLIREVFHARRENLVALDLVVQLRSDLRSQENSSIRAELAKLMDKVRRRPDPA